MTAKSSCVTFLVLHLLHFSIPPNKHSWPIGRKSKTWFKYSYPSKEVATWLPHSVDCFFSKVKPNSVSYEIFDYFAVHFDSHSKPLSITLALAFSFDLKHYSCNYCLVLFFRKLIESSDIIYSSTGNTEGIHICCSIR